MTSKPPPNISVPTMGLPVSPRRAHSRREIALARRALNKLRHGRDMRKDRVRHVRQALAVGEYENNLKLELAAERLAEDAQLTLDTWFTTHLASALDPSFR